MRVLLDLHTVPGGANGFDNGGVASNLVWLGPVRLVATHPPDHLTTEHTGQIPHTPRTPHTCHTRTQPRALLFASAMPADPRRLQRVGRHSPQTPSLPDTQRVLRGTERYPRHHRALTQWCPTEPDTKDPPSIVRRAKLRTVRARHGSSTTLRSTLSWSRSPHAPANGICASLGRCGRSHLADRTWATPLGRRPDMRSIGCGSWAGVAAVHGEPDDSVRTDR